MVKNRLLRYSLAVIIGIFLIGTDLFENKQYTSFRSKGVLTVIGAGIVAVGAANIVSLNRPGPEKKTAGPGGERTAAPEAAEEIKKNGEKL